MIINNSILKQNSRKTLISIFKLEKQWLHIINHHSNTLHFLQIYIEPIHFYIFEIFLLFYVF